MADTAEQDTGTRDTTPDGGALPEFRLGLAMAGAISAGAYTAGVADFLFQALDAWETSGTRGLARMLEDDAVAAERDSYPDSPAHRVRIASLAGASAGGTPSAIVAAVTGGPVTPVTSVPPADPLSNPFYASWVERIDMEYFLQLEDFDRHDGRLVSFLDSTRLDEITTQALKIAGPHPHRPYLADPLRVFLTVANLRGVPYQIGQEGGGHYMMSHADYMEFAVTEDAARCPGSAIRLDPNDYSHPDWQLLGQSALASGAFPMGLAPRKLRRRAGEYGARLWPVPGETGTEYKSIKPAWPFEDDFGYDFVTVDGGLMNNEPLELARQALREAGQGRNSRDPLKADRAVLMIDPFPGQPFDPDLQPDDALATIVKSMFGALKSQARFKLDELVLAQDSSVYSRFMIAPSRKRPGATEHEIYAMGSAALGGFGGFLSKKFRQHDFNLGRRNCQLFLMYHLVLHQDNKLFARWPPALKKAMARPHPAALEEARKTGTPAGNVPADHLPIVPLVGDAFAEVPWMAWPQMSDDDIARLKKQITVRSDAVLKAVLRPRIGRIAASMTAKALKGYAARKATEVICADLRKRGQLPDASVVQTASNYPDEEYNKGD